MKNKNLGAILLAAGKGTRLWPITKNTNKVLTDINGKPLIWYSISNLLSVGVQNVAVVVGYKSDKVVDYLEHAFPKERIVIIYNHNYEKTNNIYSYYLSRHYLEGKNYFRMEADLIYSKSILTNLMRSKKPITVAVKRKDVFDGDEFLVKVDQKNKTILRFGKDIPRRHGYAEAKGIEYIRDFASYEVSKSLSKGDLNNNLQKFSEHAYQMIIKNNKSYVYYKELAQHEFWHEVDNESDLKKVLAVKNL